MSAVGGAERFKWLSSAEQTRYIATNQQMTALARDHAVPIVIAPPRSRGGKINGASGCVLRLDSGTFVVTASHVLEGYETRVDRGELLNWQVGDLPPFDPLPRIAWSDRDIDLVLLRISWDESQRIGPCIISSPAKWPLAVPREGQLVLLGGYPKLSVRKTVRRVGSVPVPTLLSSR